jgi:hypothetical protein
MHASISRMEGFLVGGIAVGGGLPSVAAVRRTRKRGLGRGCGSDLGLAVAAARGSLADSPHVSALYEQKPRASGFDAGRRGSAPPAGEPPWSGLGLAVAAARAPRARPARRRRGRPARGQPGGGAGAPARPARWRCAPERGVRALRERGLRASPADSVVPRRAAHGAAGSSTAAARPRSNLAAAGRCEVSRTGSPTGWPSRPRLRPGLSSQSCSRPR